MSAAPSTLTPLTEADRAVRDYRNEVAFALGIAVGDLDNRVAHYRMTEGWSARKRGAVNYCAITTNQGVVCQRQTTLTQVSPFLWVCHHHAGQLGQALVDLIGTDELTVRDACRAAVALWERMDRDPHVRSCVDGDLADHFDHIFRQRLAATWGAS